MPLDTIISPSREVKPVPVLLRRKPLAPPAKSAAHAEKLRVCNLDFFYGTHHALKRINLPLYDKAVTALIGPSGCGKSTLIRVLNRMYDLYPDQRATGEVLMEGVNILSSTIDLNRLRRRVGMVFQRATPFPMSIFENVAFGLRQFGHVARADIPVQVEAALRRAALWDEVKDILRRSALSLSGGQQQRLCIARAIAPRPEVLLFDEPCSALDPLSTAKIENLIDELKRDFCIAMVTHNLEQAGRVADWTGFMYLGELIEFAPTYELFTRPQHESTQAFVSGRFG